MSQGVPISARISQEDADFINQLKIEGAKTPSEKIRAIIADAQRRSLGRNDYTGTLQLMQDLIAPNVIHIRESEYKHKLHSELVSAIYEWLPDAVAFLVSTSNRDMSEEDLLELEEGTAERIFRLIELLLFTGFTKGRGGYQPVMLAKHIASLLELAEKFDKRDLIKGDDP